MKRLAMALLLAAALLRPGAAQNNQAKTDTQLSPTVRLYELKNPGNSGPLSLFVMSIVKGVKIEWSQVAHALVIRGDNQQDMDAAEVLLKRFDVPQREEAAAVEAQIEITAYLIAASNGPIPTPDYRAVLPKGTPIEAKPVPAELQTAIDEMKHTFSYEHYTLADALVLEPRGEGAINGVLVPGPYVPPSTTYHLSYKHAGLDAQWVVKNMVRNKNVYLSSFQFAVEPHDVPASSIQTDVLIHENQKFVLGKIHLATADLFVILTAKLR